MSGCGGGNCRCARIEDLGVTHERFDRLRDGSIFTYRTGGEGGKTSPPMLVYAVDKPRIWAIHLTAENRQSLVAAYLGDRPWKVLAAKTITSFVCTDLHFLEIIEE